MNGNTKDCLECRSCCYFSKSAAYFAPVCSKEEKERLEKELGSKAFRPHNKPKGVFQIRLVASKKKKKALVCPFLNEETHLCKVYAKRPVDCMTWPLFFMKKRNKNLLVCYEKDVCPTTGKHSKEAFRKYVIRKINWIKREGVLGVVKKNPGLIWPCQRDVFVIAQLDSGFNLHEEPPFRS